VIFIALLAVQLLINSMLGELMSGQSDYK